MSLTGAAKSRQRLAAIVSETIARAACEKSPNCLPLLESMNQTYSVLSLPAAFASMWLFPLQLFVSLHFLGRFFLASGAAVSTRESEMRFFILRIEFHCLFEVHQRLWQTPLLQ